MSHFSIIDIETTGLSPHKDKIIELAVYISDGEQITGEFHSLINPECRIPGFITQLTGISNDMVRTAPKFYQVAKNLVELTDRKVFVAHNASFDYGFIRAEFKGLGYDFVRKNICTVRLSRKLIPGRKSYGLGKICKDLSIPLEKHHRAAGDAKATANLFHHLVGLHSLKGEGIGFL